LQVVFVSRPPALRRLRESRGSGEDQQKDGKGARHRADMPARCGEGKVVIPAKRISAVIPADPGLEPGESRDP